MNNSNSQLEAPWGHGLPPGRPGVDWKIRVAAAVWAPSSYPCLLDIKQVEDANCSYPGFAADILHLALKYAEMEYELIPYPVVESWGNLVGKVNDTWILDGLLGMIQNGTLDFVMSYYGMADTLLEAMDFTFPYEFNQMRYGYVMQKQNSMNLNSASLLYAMFSWKVWLSFAGVLVVLMLMLFLTRNFKVWAKKDIFSGHHLQVDTKKLDYSGVWDAITVFLEQHHGEPSEGILSGNLVLVILGFTCLFLHTIYE
uniref:Uncharacterized protein n=1 Tax=Plectus sambesii TaxID=2011161 RepID=A0A914XR97_9BILA